MEIQEQSMQLSERLGYLTQLVIILILKIYFIEYNKYTIMYQESLNFYKIT